MRKRSKIANPNASKLKDTFALEDMREAYDAGRARVCWEEGYGQPEAPIFEDFIKEEYSL